jgi:YVTN family beta-propeller protein
MKSKQTQRSFRIDPGTVSKINVSTDTVTETVTVGHWPRGVVFDGSHMWITNAGDDTVSKLVP